MEKQKKFHNALLKIYYPPPPPPQESQRLQVYPEPGEEPSEAPCMGQYTEIEQDAEKQRFVKNDSSDSVSEKLTRARRKRIRKRKLKEAASSRRKIIGPLLQSGYEGHEEEQSTHSIETFEDDSCKIMQDKTRDSSKLVC